MLSGRLGAWGAPSSSLPKLRLNALAGGPPEDRLDVLGVGGVPIVREFAVESVAGLDDGLALQPGHAGQCCRDVGVAHGQQDDVRVGSVAASRPSAVT